MTTQKPFSEFRKFQIFGNGNCATN